MGSRIGDATEGILGRVQSPFLHYTAKYFIPSTKAVIEDYGFRLLLVRRRSDGRWGLPSGCMMPGESAQNSVERMVEAQTGLTPRDATPFIADSGKHVRVPGKPEAQMIVFGFRIRKWDGELKTSTPDTIDAQWFTTTGVRDVLDYWNDDRTTIEDHNCTDYDPPVPPEGPVIWVR